MIKIAATATYQDTYAGAVEVRLTAFKTERQGAMVTRYRWERTNGQGCGFVAGGFPTVERAIAAAHAHRGLSNVTAA